MISTGDLKAGLWTALVVLFGATFVFLFLTFTMLLLKVLAALTLMVVFWIIFQVIRMNLEQ